MPWGRRKGLEWRIYKPRIAKACWPRAGAKRKEWNGCSLRAFRENTGLPTPWFGLLASRTVREYISVVSSTQSVVLCHGSTRKQMQRVREGLTKRQLSEPMSWLQSGRRLFRAQKPGRANALRLKWAWHVPGTERRPTGHELWTKREVVGNEPGEVGWS